MQETIRQPMKAIEFGDYEKECHIIPFPVLGTPKIDGIRALKIKGHLVSKKFKPIPNIHIRSALERSVPDNIDGELVVKNFNGTQSAVMSKDGTPDFRYYIIDYVKDSLSKLYTERSKDLLALNLPPYCIKLIPTLLNTPQELLEYLRNCLEAGFEGIVIRRPDSIYKCGRGTIKACDMIKIKIFKDAEAIIIGYEEMMENTNEAEIDALGYTKRSSAKEGKIGKALLGKWIVKGINGQFKGVTFGLGTAKGVTVEMRKEWWNNRKSYIGRTVTYKYQPHGSVDAPRIPVFKWFRDKIDM